VRCVFPRITLLKSIQVFNRGLRGCALHALADYADKIFLFFNNTFANFRRDYLHVTEQLVYWRKDKQARVVSAE